MSTRISDRPRPRAASPSRSGRALGRAAALGAALAAGAPGAASAQQQGFALSRFQPAPAGDRMFGVESPYTSGGERALHLMLLFDYAHDPLVLRSAKSNQTIGAIVGNQIFAHVNASLVLFRRLLLNLDIPAAFQTGDSPTGGGYAFTQPTAAAFGDVRLGARVAIVGDPSDAFQLALSGLVWIPTGDPTAYASDGTARGEPQIVAGGRGERFLWSVAVGAEVRAARSFVSVQTGPSIRWGAGFGYLFGGDRSLQIGPEITGAVTPADVQGQNVAVEALLGGRKRFARDFEVGVGAGAALAPGIGAPNFRAVAMLSYAAELKGKPEDRDHDGIADPEDACPDAPGPIDADRSKTGCPRPLDRDRDGIADGDDACPDLAGEPSPDAQKNGCPRPPDRDQDGIVDSDDACPSEAGEPSPDAQKNGCPKPKPEDRDRDGVFDPDDACPDLAGVASADPARNGCPDDRDGDGIVDAKDGCPREKGPADADPEKNGCPADVRVSDDAIVLLKQVQFEGAGAAIRRESFTLLDAVAQVIREHPEFTLIEVGGHTDNRIPKDESMRISLRRAEAVRDALVKRGVDRARLAAKGYGPTRPIMANVTTAGRKANRRVELKILERRR